MERKTLLVQVIGNVQGVSFRHYTKQKADQLQLDGWVRNCRDGSVETLISGSAESVAEMIQWLHHGSPHAQVDRVITSEATPEPDRSGFAITH